MRKSTVASLVLATALLAPARSEASFDKTSVVGSTINSLDDRWTCVIVNSTTINCGWMEHGTNTFVWCDPHTMPAHITASTGTGVWFAPDYNVNYNNTTSQYLAIAWLPITFSSGGTTHMGIERIGLTDPSSQGDCVYLEDQHYFPYIDVVYRLHPDVGHRLGVSPGLP